MKGVGRGNLGDFSWGWRREHQASGEEESQRAAGPLQQPVGKIQTVNERGMWFDGGMGLEGVHTSESENI